MLTHQLYFVNLFYFVNPLSAIVCNMTGKDVNTVVIDGKIVVKDRQVKTMDEGRILAEANERAEQLYQRSGLSPKPRWPMI